LASLNGALLIDLLSIIITKSLKIPKEGYESINQRRTDKTTNTIYNIIPIAGVPRYSNTG
jgi:hypothetical protein